MMYYLIVWLAIGLTASIYIIHNHQKHKGFVYVKDILLVLLLTLLGPVLPIALLAIYLDDIDFLNKKIFKKKIFNKDKDVS